MNLGVENNRLREKIKELEAELEENKRDKRISLSNLKEVLTPTGFEIIRAQVDVARRRENQERDTSGNGQRYGREVIDFSANLLGTSRACYKLVSKVFNLPCINHVERRLKCFSERYEETISRVVGRKRKLPVNEESPMEEIDDQEMLSIVECGKEVEVETSAPEQQVTDFGTTQDSRVYAISMEGSHGNQFDSYEHRSLFDLVDAVTLKLVDDAETMAE